MNSRSHDSRGASARRVWKRAVVVNQESKICWRKEARFLAVDGSVGGPGVL